MNKHVSKLSKEASEARRMLEDSESDSEDSDDAAGGDKKRSGRTGGRGGEKPSEEHVEKLEEKLEAAQADQKNLFLIIFQVPIQIQFKVEHYCSKEVYQLGDHKHPEYCLGSKSAELWHHNPMHCVTSLKKVADL